MKTTNNKRKYTIGKDKARDLAIGYQIDISDNNYSYGEIIEIQTILYKLGKRYGLLKEFKENGVI